MPGPAASSRRLTFFQESMDDHMDDQRHSFGEILLAIKRHLADARQIGLPRESIRLIARPDGTVPHLSGQRDILIRPGRFLTIGPMEPGEAETSARVQTRVQRTVYVFPRLSMILDEVGSDEQWLCDPKDGIFAFEDALLNLLQDHHPTDRNGTELTTQGLMLTSGEAAEKELRSDPKTGGGPQWGHSCVVFVATYLPPIDPGKYGSNE